MSVTVSLHFTFGLHEKSSLTLLDLKDDIARHKTT